MKLSIQVLVMSALVVAVPSFSGAATAGDLIAEQDFLQTFLPPIMQEFSAAGGNAAKVAIMQTAVKQLAGMEQGAVKPALLAVFEKAIMLGSLKEGSLQQAQDALGSRLLVLQSMLKDDTALDEIGSLFDQNNFFVAMQQFMDNQGM